ncbi:MAG: hypothetical protein QOE19_2963 [Actinomycetota bacterium]|jgi:hypothetical protein|nr:hypothetical protein [Actinomycetota bacterium]MDQ1669498.1 hypothetical protein [Actinomycetota bacterium]
MVARRDAAEAPEEFLRALAALRAATPRPEVALEETPAPQRLAPHAVALTADVTTAGEEDELATGRFVLLHDPVGHEAWAGTFRVVTYVRADLEPEMAVDPLLAGVGWAWLTESLEGHGASFTAASGTVTRVSSESFGAIAEETGSAQIEIRASWTPLDEGFDAHLLAWCDLLCTTAGLPPVAPGVLTLARRRPGSR